jgi:hypothetical protein
MRAIGMAVTEGYWQQLLEAFYDAFETRDASGYAWAPSDGWTQSRDTTLWTKHLECWVDLGSVGQVTRDAYVHDSSVAFGLRYSADDDSTSQARMHAAMRDACECVLRAPLPYDCRATSITSVQIAGPLPSGYVECVVRFSLHVPR